MNTLLTFILAAVMLLVLKLIQNGKLPKANEPNGLPTRILLVALLIPMAWMLISSTLGGGFTRTNIVITLTAIGSGILALSRARRRQDMRKAGTEDKNEKKRAFIFLGVAILVAAVLVIISLPANH